MSLKAHSKESPVLYGAIARRSGLDTRALSSSGCDTRALSGSGSWCSVLQCLKNVDNALASTHVRLVASTRNVAVSLILCPLAVYIVAAQTLIAFLHTYEVKGAAVAALLALRNSQGCIPVCIRIQLEEWVGRILSVASQGFPGGRGRRERRRSCARSGGGGHLGGSCRWFQGVQFSFSDEAIGLPTPDLAIRAD